MYENDLEGKLEWTMLRAFANDVPVIGVHVLTHRDPNVPHVEVEVKTADGSRSGWPAVESEDDGGRREAFETELRDVLLTAYADDRVAFPTERWELSFASELIPDWSVTVTFHGSEEESITRDGPKVTYDRV